MKSLTSILIVVMLLASTVSFGQDQLSSQFLSQAHQCYLNSLKSENAGVRNSVIFNIVQLKKSYPQQNFKPFIKEIRKISQNDPLLQNRLHAQFALICLEKPDVMTSFDPNNFEDPVIFFDAIYDQLTAPVLTLK